MAETYHRVAGREQRPARRIRVLVIDDNQNIRKLLSAVFRRQCDVATTDSVDDALRILAAHPTDLVVIDYEMPGKDGLQGIREIRQVDQNVCILMLTGSATGRLIQEALSEGADACLSKPFNVRNLRDLAMHHLVRRQTAWACACAAAASAACAPTAAPI